MYVCLTHRHVSFWSLVCVVSHNSHLFICTAVCIYICIYRHEEREREKGRDRGRDRVGAIHIIPPDWKDLKRMAAQLKTWSIAIIERKPSDEALLARMVGSLELWQHALEEAEAVRPQKFTLV